MRSKAAIASLAIAGAAMVARPALANGRYPLAGQLVFSPSQPGLLALRATFGLLVSQDAGRSWDWICEPAVGYTDTNEDPSIAWTAGAAIVGMSKGLAVSPDRGCSWSTKVPSIVIDVVVRRDDTHAAFALTTKYESTNDAGQLLYDSHVYVTPDDGATWSTFGAALDPTVIPETVDVSADGSTVFVSGYRILPGNKNEGVLEWTTDQGAHYTSSTIALGETEAAPFIGAIDPQNPMRLYVRIPRLALAAEDAGPPGDRLIVTDDGGQTFRTVFMSAGSLLGFALSPDGSKVYVGGPNDGVQVATRDALQFTQKSTMPVYCLAANGTSLYACSDDAVAFLLGASTDDGATFTPLLYRSCVRRALACPANTSTAQCAPIFDTLSLSQVGVGGPMCGDAGAGALVPSDAGTAPDAGAGHPSGGHSSCAFGATPGAWPAGVGTSGAALALAFRRLRRKKRGGKKA